MEASKKDGVVEARRWRKVVECGDNQPKRILLKQVILIKERVTEYPDSKYYITELSTATATCDFGS